MFTLEESALLRRMLHVLMWVCVSLGIAGAFFLTRPWLGRLWTSTRALLLR